MRIRNSQPRNPSGLCLECGKDLHRHDLNTCPATRHPETGKRVASKCERKRNMRQSKISYQKYYKKDRASRTIQNNKRLARRTPEADSLDYIKTLKPVVKKRFCLKCSKKFTSVSTSNRICQECNNINNR